MLLIFDRPLSPLEGAALMEVYRESNTDNIDYFFPGCTDRAEGLRKVEEGFLQFLDRFFADGRNSYYVWEEDGRWLAALRLTELDGFWYLEALETRPDARRQGHARALFHAVTGHLRTRGPVVIRDCVSKTNAPSLAFHRKCGFAVELEDGVDHLDGSINERMYGMIYREG